jgi:nicotinate-nucleotide adenylyltransferase
VPEALAPAPAAAAAPDDRAAPAALGVLGGSFDPIHHGHLRLAEEAIERLGLSRVLMVPARPWQRLTQAGAEQRLQMVRLACTDNLRLQVEALEIEQPGPSYTVQTLQTLRVRHGPATPLWLVLGADAFLGLPSWRDWRDLPRLCNLAVVPRPGVPIDALLPAELRAWWDLRATPEAAGVAGGLALMEAPELGISATAIRKMLSCGRSPRYLLPDPVLDYIDFEGLYTVEGHGA